MIKFESLVSFKDTLLKVKIPSSIGSANTAACSSAISHDATLSIFDAAGTGTISLYSCVRIKGLCQGCHTFFTESLFRLSLHSDCNQGFYDFLVVLLMPLTVRWIVGALSVAEACPTLAELDGVSRRVIGGIAGVRPPTVVRSSLQ